MKDDYMYKKNFLHVRVKTVEKGRWKEAADVAQMPYSEWVRYVLNKECERLGVKIRFDSYVSEDQA